MQYIILDMEWNQPWPGSYSAKKALPSPLRGEIVQIGAVRMTQDQQVADEFQILIRPKYFKKMNRKVASLTGIRDSVLREKGVSFPEAAAKFQTWCGEACVFLTWGFDDITVLRENLAVFGLADGWTARWYNAQLIFNAQTDGSGAQKALSTAMQMMDIEPTRAAHDALHTLRPWLSSRRSVCSNPNNTPSSRSRQTASRSASTPGKSRVGST